MLRRTRNFAVRLHEDETGPNTVEWVLLIIVALIILVLIFWFTTWVYDQFESKAKSVQDDAFLQK